MSCFFFSLNKREKRKEKDLYPWYLPIDSFGDVFWRCHFHVSKISMSLHLDFSFFFFHLHPRSLFSIFYLIWHWWHTLYHLLSKQAILIMHLHFYLPHNRQTGTFPWCFFFFFLLNILQINIALLISLLYLNQCRKHGKDLLGCDKPGVSSYGDAWSMYCNTLCCFNLLDSFYHW